MNIPHKQSDSIELGNGSGAPLPAPLRDCVFYSQFLRLSLLPSAAFPSFFLLPLASFPSFYSDIDSIQREVACIENQNRRLRRDRPIFDSSSFRRCLIETIANSLDSNPAICIIRPRGGLVWKFLTLPRFFSRNSIQREVACIYF